MKVVLQFLTIIVYFWWPNSQKLKKIFMEFYWDAFCFGWCTANYRRVAICFHTVYIRKTATNNTTDRQLGVQCTCIRRGAKSPKRTANTTYAVWSLVRFCCVNVRVRNPTAWHLAHANESTSDGRAVADKQSICVLVSSVTWAVWLVVECRHLAARIWCAGCICSACSAENVRLTKCCVMPWSDKCTDLTFHVRAQVTQGLCFECDTGIKMSIRTVGNVWYCVNELKNTPLCRFSSHNVKFRG